MKYIAISFVLAIVGLIIMACPNPLAGSGSTSDPRNGFVVTFESNNGAAQQSATVNGSTNLVLPLPPTKASNCFKGWYTGDNGTGTLFTRDTVVTGDIKVYAKWKVMTASTTNDSIIDFPAEDYDDGNLTAGDGWSPGATPKLQNTYWSVIFDAQNDTFSFAGSLNPLNTNCTFPANPSRTGYTFLGWFEDPIAGSVALPLFSRSTSVNVVVYAHWSKN